MSIQGKAAKSASGAAMSKYDVEVESRLQKLEAAIHLHEGGGEVDGDRLAVLESRVEEVVAALKRAAPGATRKMI